MARAHQFAQDALQLLVSLDSSWYNSAPGSRECLESMGAVVSGVSLAGTDLATVIYHNPLDGEPSPGPRGDEASIRRNRHSHAKPRVTESLDNAAHQLEVAAVACRYTATTVEQAHTRLVDSRERRARNAPPAKLSTAQWAALRAIAQGGVHVRKSLSGRITWIKATDGTRIIQPTLDVLEKHRLVQVDTRPPPHRERPITLTARGRQALYQRDRPGGNEAPAVNPPHPGPGKSR
ncbi:hypothetical protein ACL02R_11620 [Streptomyces sp. MS19]|uniref:hypothetical protein n=1 Tax=Streptomyces sp. MS19 TaxID=3385972 RepID=UPI0039A3891F